MEKEKKTKKEEDQLKRKIDPNWDPNWKLESMKDKRPQGRPITVFGKNFRVTWLGTVVDTDTGEVVEFNKENSGFKCRSIRFDGKVRDLYLHKLLAIAWLSAKENSKVVHKDGDKNNNHVSNLEVK